MAGLKTLQEISIEKAKKQPKQVQYLTEGAPFLDKIRYEAASHGLWNTYEVVTDIVGPALVGMDEPLPYVDTSSELKRIDLDMFGGQIEKGEDALKMFGGMAKYIAKKESIIMKKFGMNAETRILYHYIRRFALENGVKNIENLYYGLNTTADTGYSILAYREEEGVTNGLYNPQGFGQGAMMDYTPLSNGGLYKMENKSMGYGGRWKSHMGFQIASPRTVGAIVNLGPTDFTTTNKKATQDKIQNLLSDIRADSGSMLVMHQRLLNMMSAFKLDSLQMRTGDKNFDTRIADFDGIRVLTTYNMSNGKEAIVA